MPVDAFAPTAAARWRSRILHRFRALLDGWDSQICGPVPAQVREAPLGHSSDVRGGAFCKPQ